MAREIQISDSEWSVMEPVWQSGMTTAAEIIKQLRTTHNWSHSTIRTLLARLVEKGALGYDVDGPRYIYRPLVTREQCVSQEGRSFLHKAFGGDVSALVAHFVSSSPLSGDDIDRLRKLLAEKQSPKGKQK